MGSYRQRKGRDGLAVPNTWELFTVVRADPRDPRDPHQLDGNDNDGIMCESNRAPFDRVPVRR